LVFPLQSLEDTRFAFLVPIRCPDVSHPRTSGRSHLRGIMEEWERGQTWSCRK
jgi:hypothetical protein